MSRRGGPTVPKRVTTSLNKYEEQRRMTIQSNNSVLESLGIRRIANSLTSLADSSKEKRNKGTNKDTLDDDDEYVPDDDLIEEECEREVEVVITNKAKTNEARNEKKKGKFIPPMSVAKFLKMNKNQQQAAVGNEAFKSLSTALELVEKAINSQEQTDEDPDNVDLEEDIQDLDADQSTGNDENIEMEEDFSKGIGLSDASAAEIDEIYGDSPSNALVTVEREHNISGTVTKRRGIVYCRKLIALPPGEKLNVEYDEDGNPIGPNSTLFAFFLGEQVRNRSVFPIEVKGWNELKPETLDHLWTCVLEKFSFDDMEYRKQFVLKHAQCLFRDSRHKLKSTFFDDPNLETKEQRIKNKPPYMNKGDWKYLVEHWSDPTLKAKSEKEKKSRSFQKMPHYSGTKSYARLKEEIKKKNGGRCTRVDVMVESRARKSKKHVNEETLANNLHAADEMKKLKEQREQGVIEKTDEQIFQDVLGKDKHGYLRAHGPGKSITKHFQVKPSRLDLAQEMDEVRKSSEQVVMEARKEAQEAKKDAEYARKEAEATRNEVDAKIAANNEVWEKRLKEILQVNGLDSTSNDDPDDVNS